MAIMKNKQKTQKCQICNTVFVQMFGNVVVLKKKLGYYFKFRHPVLIFIILHIITILLLL